jgi:glycosyltransferase involved in cell wall biosynthesis
MRMAVSQPLHACMVAYTFYENDGRVMRYARALADAGASVDAIVLRRPGQVAEEVMDGVRVIRVQEREKNESGKLSYLQRVLAFLLRSGVTLARRHRARKYDLVHVHSVPDFEVFAALAPKIGGAGIILDIHDIVPEFYAAKFGRSTDSMIFKMLVAAERASAAFADHVIIANDLWRQRLVARSVPEAKCTSLINFPDVKVFRPDLRTRQPDGRFRLAYPGSLNYHQGLDIALEAVNIARKELAGIAFDIYGEGPERERLAAQVRDLGLESHVQLHGARPLSQIAQVMADADLGVVPKRNDSFGGDAFSTKILEFMAVGVPLVVADTRVDKYYFDETMLRFFRAGDPADLASAILAAYRDPADTQKRAAAGLRYVEENNWGKKQAAYLDLVARLTRE